MEILEYLIYKFLIELKLNRLIKTINKFLLKVNIKKLKVIPKSEDIYITKIIDNNITINPLISIIIPFKDKPELLVKCITSILNSTYENFEIIAVNNNSNEKETFEEIEKLKCLDKRIKFIDYNVPFNFSRINNYAVKNFAKGEFLVFMNNDIELLTKRWIEEFLKYTNLEKVGIIGAKLYYPNDIIQHAGIVMLDKHGFSEHIGRFEKRDNKDKFYNTPRYVMANTAALIMVKKELFNKINGFDENLAIDYNDVDLSLKCLEKGYKNIWLPSVEAYHYESISRGKNHSVEKLKRYEKERQYLVSKHYDLIKDGDIYYKVIL